MRILIRFEDNYGCHTLFKYSKSILNLSEEHDIQVQEGLCDSVVFKISSSLLNIYDYVLIVFDLDTVARDSCILTGDSLKHHLEKHILEGRYIKNKLNAKIVLIPVFICFETSYLFSECLQSIIRNIENYENGRETSLIKLYKRYYDYSLKCPEHLYNIENFLENIKYEEYLIRGLQSKSKWLPQKFHLKYSEQLLRVAFQKILKENDNGKIFIKHEDQLFKSINVLEDATNADAFAADIINGIAQGIHNRRFHKFLTLEHIDELKEMVLTDYTLDLLCKELDDYHQSLQGIQKDICDYIDKENGWMCGLSPQ